MAPQDLGRRSRGRGGHQGEGARRQPRCGCRRMARRHHRHPVQRRQPARRVQRTRPSSTPRPASGSWTVRACARPCSSTRPGPEGPFGSGVGAAGPERGRWPARPLAKDKTAIVVGANFYAESWVKSTCGPCWLQAPRHGRDQAADHQRAGPAYASSLGGWELSIGAQTAHPQLAWDFIQTAQQQTNMIDAGNWGGWVPPSNKASSAAAFVNYAPPYQAFFAKLCRPRRKSRLPRRSPSGDTGSTTRPAPSSRIRYLDRRRDQRDEELHHRPARRRQGRRFPQRSIRPRCPAGG